MSFKGTEHYREKATGMGTRERAWYWTLLHTEYQNDILALCDHVEELQDRLSAPRDKDGLTADQVYHWQENALKRIAELEKQQEGEG